MKIYCSHCGKHEFRVDKETAKEAEILMLGCPKCGKKTQIFASLGGIISVLPEDCSPTKIGTK